MKYHGDRDRRTAPDDGARKRTVRGLLMVMRLRVEITTREAAQSADPRIEEARQELRVLTGRHGLTGARGSPRPPVALRWGCWSFTRTSSNRHRAQPADTTMHAGDHDPCACP